MYCVWSASDCGATGYTGTAGECTCVAGYEGTVVYDSTQLLLSGCTACAAGEWSADDSFCVPSDCFATGYTGVAGSCTCDEGFDGTLNGSLHEKISFDGIAAEKVKSIQIPTFDSMNQMAMAHSDAVVAGSEELTAETQAAFNALDVPTMNYMDSELCAAEMLTFYDSILEGKGMAVEE